MKILTETTEKKLRHQKKNYNSKKEDNKEKDRREDENELFPDEYNSILIRTEINVPEIPKMKADNK